MAGGSREIVERYADAFAAGDIEAQQALMHDEVSDHFPQSGERVIGRENLRAIFENYPGSGEEPLRAEPATVVGQDDQWVVGPSFNVTHIAGSGDEYVLVLKAHYPDGKDWHVLQLLTLRDDRIWRMTSYFAEPFDPPAWRAPYVEVTGDSSIS